LNIMSCMVSDSQAKAIVGPDRPANAGAMLKTLDCSSVSTYCYIHHYPGLATDGFPTIPYEKAFASAKKYWTEFTGRYPGVLYTPNVSMGWDASPRCMYTDRFQRSDYPWTAVLTGNTPAAFGAALREARHFL